jgi:hypothetical protein
MTSRSRRIRISVSEDQYDKLCRLATKAGLEPATETYLLLVDAIWRAWARWEELEAAFERGTSHDGGLEGHMQAYPAVDEDPRPFPLAFATMEDFEAALSAWSARQSDLEVRDGPEI